MKLSLDALKERAEATASMDLLATISGGTENSCHPASAQKAEDDANTLKEMGDRIIAWWKSL
jgi:hypothetical protein